MGSLPKGVGMTALGVAMVRATESAREDRLFDDPYARAFVDAAPGEFVTSTNPEVARALYSHVVVRTRFYDRHLLAATAAGCRQVVLLAAGLDTRAFRLPWPDGVRVFELDLAEVLAFKDSVLDAVPACGRVVVPVDLLGDWAPDLLAAGFDPAAPTAWLAEGLLIYLSADEADHLLAVVSGLSAPAGSIAFERGGGTVRVTPAMAGYAALWKGGFGEGGADRLRAHGWLPRSHDLGSLAADYGRPAAAGGGFLTAVRPSAGVG